MQIRNLMKTQKSHSIPVCIFIFCISCQWKPYTPTPRSLFFPSSAVFVCLERPFIHRLPNSEEKLERRNEFHWSQYLHLSMYSLCSSGELLIIICRRSFQAISTRNLRRNNVRTLLHSWNVQCTHCNMRCLRRNWCEKIRQIHLIQFRYIQIQYRYNVKNGMCLNGIVWCLQHEFNRMECCRSNGK